LLAAESMLRRPEVSAGLVNIWTNQSRSQLEKIYGRESPLLAGFPPRGIDQAMRDDPRAVLAARVGFVERYIKQLELVPKLAMSKLGGKIFIGHGRSRLWLELKDFLRDRCHLPCDEFNVEPSAGLSTTERLQAMLEDAAFAFIVMTAEERHGDGLVYARPNVIHESGLFQAKLGLRRAIVMLEEGCSDFTNISGLTQIRFPRDHIRAAFEDVRFHLEREGLLSTSR